MLNIAGLLFLGWLLFWCYGMWQMMTEQHYYYWKLIAVRHSTDSEVLKFVKVPASIGKIPGLKAAMIDFQNEMGPCWKVTHQAMSEQYFAMRVKVLEREEAKLKG